METHEMVEQMITDRIEEELKRKEDFSRDPLGYSLYSFFLLKNGIRTPEVENLTDWMNSWVDDIINQRKISRFVDRDFSSALFSYYCLRKFRRLKKKVQLASFDQLLSSYVESNRFFDSFTFSAIILIGMLDMKDEIDNYSNVINRLKNDVERETVFNDAKNLVFASIFFEQLGSGDYLKRIVDFCWKKLMDNSIPIYDELYFAWVLWKFRKLREERDLPKIREFTDSTITNGRKFLHKEPRDESIEEIYGSDIKTNRIGFNLSKIALGVFLDILKDYLQRTVRVTREEMARKDIPVWIRSSSLIASILLVSEIPILWASFGFGLVRRATLNTSNLTWQSFWPAGAQYLINASIFLIVMGFAVISVSLLWDTVYKGYTDAKIVKNNLIKRLTNRFFDFFVILLTIAAAIFGL
jgi:hypothetical protein